MIDPRIYEVLPVFSLKDIPKEDWVYILNEARKMRGQFLCFRLDAISLQGLTHMDSVTRIKKLVVESIDHRTSLETYLSREHYSIYKYLRNTPSALRDAWIDKLIDFNKDLNHV